MRFPAGSLLVCKIAGAAAAAGLSLDEAGSGWVAIWLKRHGTIFIKAWHWLHFGSSDFACGSFQKGHSGLAGSKARGGVVKRPG